MAIIADILPGLAETETLYYVEPDRRRAIDLALSSAGEGDVVVLAGKGHETYQELGGHRIDFDERDIIASCFSVGTAQQKMGEFDGKHEAAVVK